MDWLTAAGTVVGMITGLSGLGISLYTLKVTRQKEQRRVKVTIGKGIVPTLRGAGPPMLIITALNPGDRTVTLGSPGILLPNNKHIVFLEPLSNVEYPHELAEGKNCMTWTPAKEIAQMLQKEGFSGAIKLRGFYDSSIGEKYTSEAITFEVDKFAVWDEK